MQCLMNSVCPQTMSRMHVTSYTFILLFYCRLLLYMVVWSLMIWHLAQFHSFQKVETQIISIPQITDVSLPASF